MKTWNNTFKFSFGQYFDRRWKE